ncbi:glycosyltransferase [Nocardioides jiangxiensis]|uniref:Glycosyltransferase n=1 Tax=Nocardioides jiangxiensis TaxID=3064524 RepID=A0ABT9AYH6_9ACTN|nr:glycosyltransferase [Nocardioides sp. WY-20]MDO7867549.1 glycosyltransferase [Nocardioides sp. WY-20]
MRIAVSAEAFYPATDADTRTVKALVDHLVDAGHDVLVLAPAPGLADYRGCTVARITLREGRGVQVREALVGFGADALVAVSPTKVGRKALKHARKLGVRTLVLQASPVSTVDAEVWSRTVAPRADRLVVTAGWMVDRCAALGASSAVHWQPGVDARGFTPAVRDDYLHGSFARARAKGGPRVVVGHAGALKRRHGVRRLVDVARVPGGRLVVIGEGAQKAWLAAQVDDARLTGHLSDTELAVALASLDVLVQPSEVETCAHLLRAGMASGLAVVAPAAGAAAEIVRHGETGLLYDPADPAALRRSVARLVAEADLRERLGHAAREDALTRDWTSALTELVEAHLAPCVAAAGTAA